MQKIAAVLIASASLCTVTTHAMMNRGHIVTKQCIQRLKNPMVKNQYAQVIAAPAAGAFFGAGSITAGMVLGAGANFLTYIATGDSHDIFGKCGDHMYKGIEGRVVGFVGGTVGAGIAAGPIGIGSWLATLAAIKAYDMHKNSDFTYLRLTRKV